MEVRFSDEAYASFEYDSSIDKLFARNLRWRPWVGKSYEGSDKKILVVGESHYTCESTVPQEELEARFKSESEDRDHTRWVIFESQICKDWGNRTFDNLNRILIGDNNSDRKQLWSHIAYYNLVQRLMKTRSERPTWDDMQKGWENFIDLFHILKPAACIVFGVGNSNSFNYQMKNFGIEHHGLVLGEKISNTSTRNGASIEGIPISFIQHPGRAISWKKWREYLFQKIPDAMNFLNTLQ